MLAGMAWNTFMYISLAIQFLTREMITMKWQQARKPYSIENFYPSKYIQVLQIYLTNGTGFKVLNTNHEENDRIQKLNNRWTLAPSLAHFSIISSSFLNKF